MKHLKWLTGCLLVGTMLFTLAACGQQVPQQTQTPENSTESQQTETSQPEQTVPRESGAGKTLVAYYSATGNTKAVAGTIADSLDADLFEIIPAQPYTSEDLNWSDENSRVSKEHEDESLRTMELTAATVENWDEYDTVFIGYPIWWGIAAWPVDAFIAANDFTGKTVIPFATSSSSGLGESGTLLAQQAGTGDWLDGQRFRSGESEDSVREWVAGLNITASASTEQPSASLVVYFSMPETTDPDNMTEEEDNSTIVIDGKVLGNTQYMAQVIEETTAADIFRIEPETPYPTDHDTLVEQASKEQADETRPAIKSQIENFDQYGTVFVGYPNWWGDMPMLLYTFFDNYDFSGQTIIPFNTHGGSGFSGTINTIQQMEPTAQVMDGLSISRNSIQDAQQEIVEWVNGLDF